MTLSRGLDGGVDLDQFAHHLEQVSSAGIEGFVLNGATGEYCLTSCEELGQMLHRARKVIGGRAKLLAAIGGASVAQTLQRLEVAESSGADGLLLPMPYFFPYQQEDLIAYATKIAERASLPMLLYNLPSFTSSLEPLTTLRLLQDVPNLKGIKDSSGALDTVRLMVEHTPAANRVIGNDGALYPALMEGLCDGVVSGVACVLPEFMQEFYRVTSIDPYSGTALAMKNTLEEFLVWLGKFPVPWGLKMIAAERGFSQADYCLPLSASRREAKQLFLEWFRLNRSLLLRKIPMGHPASIIR